MCAGDARIKWRETKRCGHHLFAKRSDRLERLLLQKLANRAKYNLPVITGLESVALEMSVSRSDAQNDDSPYHVPTVKYGVAARGSRVRRNFALASITQKVFTLLCAPRKTSGILAPKPTWSSPTSDAAPCVEWHTDELLSPADNDPRHTSWLVTRRLEHGHVQFILVYLVYFED